MIIKTPEFIFKFFTDFEILYFLVVIMNLLEVIFLIK